MKVKHLKIDFSALDTWRSCPRKFMYSYVRGLQSNVESDALAFGRAIHVAMAAYHSNAVVSADSLQALRSNAAQLIADKYIAGYPGLDAYSRSINAYLQEISKTHLNDYLPEQQRSRAAGIQVLTAYFEKYPNPMSDFQPVIKDGQAQVELFLSRPLTERVTYCGHVDILCTDAVVDHKTTSQINEAFVTKSSLNAQFAGYVWLAQQFNPALQTCIDNGIQTRTYKTKQDFRFLRLHSVKTEDEINEWKSDTIYDCNRIIQDLEANYFSTNKPNACSSFNSVCPFADACLAPSALRQTVLDNAYTVRPWPGLEVTWEQP